MTSRRRALAVSAVLAVLIGAPTSSAAWADTSTSAPSASPTSGAVSTATTFGLHPSSTAAGEQADDRPYFQYGVTPGTVIQDAVAVTNFSQRPLALQLYSTDSFNTADGDFALLSGDQHPVDAGAWTSLRTPRAVTVPARSVDGAGNQVAGRLVVPFTVTVPSNATPGDHVGGVVASLNTSSLGADGPAVRLDQRVATRMFLRVAGPVHPTLVVSGVGVHYRAPGDPFGSGSASVSFTLRNAGNVSLTGHELVSVRGLFQSSEVTDVLLPLLLPGAAISRTVTVTGLRTIGRLHAHIAVTGLSSPGHPIASGVQQLGAASTVALPWVTLTTAASVLALLVVAILLFRRAVVGRAAPARHGNARRQVPPGRRSSHRELSRRGSSRPAKARHGLP